MKNWFTSKTNKATSKVSLGEIQAISLALQRHFADSFRGMQVKVDEGLSGNEYYVSVSQELYDEIAKENQK